MFGQGWGPRAQESKFVSEAMEYVANIMSKSGYTWDAETSRQYFESCEEAIKSSAVQRGKMSNSPGWAYGHHQNAATFAVFHAQPTFEKLAAKETKEERAETLQSWINPKAALLPLAAGFQHACNYCHKLKADRLITDLTYNIFLQRLIGALVDRSKLESDLAAGEYTVTARSEAKVERATEDDGLFEPLAARRIIRESEGDNSELMHPLGFYEVKVGRSAAAVVRVVTHGAFGDRVDMIGVGGERVWLDDITPEMLGAASALRALSMRDEFGFFHFKTSRDKIYSCIVSHRETIENDPAPLWHDAREAVNAGLIVLNAVQLSAQATTRVSLAARQHWRDAIEAAGNARKLRTATRKELPDLLDVAAARAIRAPDAIKTLTAEDIGRLIGNALVLATISHDPVLEERATKCFGDLVWPPERRQ